MVRDLVDEVVLVSESEIAAAMRSLFMQEGWVAEGAGAIGVALLERGAARRSGGSVAIVVSGRNIDMGRFLKIVAARPTAEERRACRDVTILTEKELRACVALDLEAVAIVERPSRRWRRAAW